MKVEPEEIAKLSKTRTKILQEEEIDKKLKINKAMVFKKEKTTNMSTLSLI